MRSLIALLLASISLCANAATYYIDSGASGMNDGTSPTDAWEDESGFNGATFTAGDDVYSRAGQGITIATILLETTFTGVSAANPAIFGAYYVDDLGAAQIGLNRTNVSSLTCAAGTVTVDTDAPHYYSTNDWVEVWDADQDEYVNGPFQVASVTDADTFTYTISSCATATTGTGPIVTQFRRPFFRGRADWSDHDWNGTWTTQLSDAQLIATVPPCANDAVNCTGVNGSSQGIFNINYTGRQYITVQDVEFMYSGGWGIRAVTSDGTPENGIIIDNVYVHDTLAQVLHISNLDNSIVRNSWFTGGCQTHKYIGGGSTRGTIAWLRDDLDDNYDNLTQGNHLWDNLCGEGLNANGGISGIAFVDNLIVDGANLAGVYLEASRQMLVAYDIFLRTDRAPYSENLGSDVGIYLNNEQSEPPNWDCDPATTILEAYRTQNTLIVSNVVAGFDWGFAPTSQATNAVGADCEGAASNDFVYVYNNLFVDPEDDQNRMLNTSYVDQNAMGENPRIWGNAYVFTHSPTNIASAASTDWTGFIDTNYITTSLASFGEWDSNTITSGCSLPLADYNLAPYMDTDAAGHMSEGQLRNFERKVLQLNSDDLTDRDTQSLGIFHLTGSNCSGTGVALASLTLPEDLDAGFPGSVSQTLLDVRHQPLPAAPDIGAMLQSHGYPWIRSVVADADTASTDAVFDLPTDAEVGDTILLCFNTGDQTITEAMGWNQLADIEHTVDSMRTWVGWHEWTGTEGATETFSLGGASLFSTLVMAIADAADPDDIPPEAGTTVNDGTGTTGDPGSATASGGAQAMLRVLCAGVDEDTVAVTATPPTGYVLHANTSDTTTSVRMVTMVAKEDDAATDDADVFTWSLSQASNLVPIMVFAPEVVAAASTTNQAKKIGIKIGIGL